MTGDGSGPFALLRIRTADPHAVPETSLSSKLDAPPATRVALQLGRTQAPAPSNWAQARVNRTLRHHHSVRRRGGQGSIIDAATS